MTLVRTFKFELIKIIVFLFLFALAVFYVTITQDDYYHPAPQKHYNYKDTSAVNNS